MRDGTARTRASEKLLPPLYGFQGRPIAAAAQSRHFPGSCASPVTKLLMLTDDKTQKTGAKVTSKLILFVDDDQDVLDEVRALLDAGAGYQMAFAKGGKEALGKLEQSEFDVVVADMHMPDMNGAELLTEVARLCPHTVRILLSAGLGVDLVRRSSTTAHQFMTKPCDAATLRATLDRALRMREMLVLPGLKTVVSRMTSLPSL